MRKFVWCPMSVKGCHTYIQNPPLLNSLSAAGIYAQKPKVSILPKLPCIGYYEVVDS